MTSVDSQIIFERRQSHEEKKEEVALATVPPYFDIKYVMFNDAFLFNRNGTTFYALNRVKRAINIL